MAPERGNILNPYEEPEFVRRQAAARARLEKERALRADTEPAAAEQLVGAIQANDLLLGQTTVTTHYFLVREGAEYLVSVERTRGPAHLYSGGDD